MLSIRRVTARKVFMGKLCYDGDLLGEITKICQRENICLGRIKALGAVQKARLGFYHQQKKEYAFIDIDKPLEIASLIGNVSLKDGAPVVHAHVTLADENGIAFGGHLASGTVIFACEVIIETFDGPSFNRAFDEQTGLPLWI